LSEIPEGSFPKFRVRVKVVVGRSQSGILQENNYFRASQVPNERDWDKRQMKAKTVSKPTAADVLVKISYDVLR
jgi:hypothetical protein